MKNFKPKEFACPCCSLDSMNAKFLENLDELRDRISIPLKINSGFRCATHNRAVKGAIDSYHLQGRAADISFTSMKPEKRHEFLELALFHFTGVGIAKTFLHVDNREVPYWWVY